MLDILSTTRWLKNRDEVMQLARQTHYTLTNPVGHYRYAADDQRVKAAVRVWVQKARTAHHIAMGRRPVIDKAIVINQGEAVQGPLYAA
jgi:hypothetical protein